MSALLYPVPDRLQAAAAGMTPFMLAVCEAMHVGARLRRAVHPVFGNRWELEQLAFERNDARRWFQMVGIEAPDDLLHAGRIYRTSELGVWTYYALATDDA